MKTSTHHAFIPFDRDRRFRNLTDDSGPSPKSVTIKRNPRSRSNGIVGHVPPEIAVTMVRNTHMRLLVLFDLPVVTRAERKAYTLFRRFLINDGYDMIQFSIYGRILNGNDAEQKHMKRLIDNLPPEGSVRCLAVTEKQFAGMKLLVGLPLFQEKTVPANQMLLF